MMKIAQLFPRLWAAALSEAALADGLPATRRCAVPDRLRQIVVIGSFLRCRQRCRRRVFDKSRPVDLICWLTVGWNFFSGVRLFFGVRLSDRLFGLPIVSM